MMNCFFYFIISVSFHVPQLTENLMSSLQDLVNQVCLNYKAPRINRLQMKIYISLTHLFTQVNIIIGSKIVCNNAIDKLHIVHTNYQHRQYSDLPKSNVDH